MPKPNSIFGADTFSQRKLLRCFVSKGIGEVVPHKTWKLAWRLTESNAQKFLSHQRRCFCTAIAQHKAENRHEASNHLAHCATKPHPVWANIKKFTMLKTCFHDDPDAPSKSSFLKQFVFEYCEKKQLKLAAILKLSWGEPTQKNSKNSKGLCRRSQRMQH